MVRKIIPCDCFRNSKGREIMSWVGAGISLGPCGKRGPTREMFCFVNSNFLKDINTEFSFFFISLPPLQTR